MKQILFFVALTVGFLFSAQSTQANVPCFAGVTVSIGEPETTAKTAPTAKKEKLAWLKNAAVWVAKKVSEMDQDQLIFIVLTILIGWLGVHRVVAGAKPVIILWYFLVALGVTLLYVLLSILTFGIFGAFGWLLYYILPIFDLIKVLTKGIGHFKGNNDLFASFK
jgi:hypothetical protein